MGQRWHECEPVTEKELAAAAKPLGLTLSDPIKELLRRCAGGVPEKSYFHGHSVEVAIGRVLDVTTKKARRSNSLGVVVAQARRAGLPEGIVPFAFDNGNDGLLCVKNSREVVYFTTDPAGTTSRVADSMEAFLNGLKAPPY